MDLLLIDGGRLLVAKNMQEPRVHRSGDRQDQADARIAGRGEGPGRAFSAVGLVASGDRMFATDSQGAVRIAAEEGTDLWLGWHFVLKAPGVGGAAYPTGMALQGDSHVWVCASRGNELQLIELTDR